MPARFPRLHFWLIGALALLLTAFWSAGAVVSYEQFKGNTVDLSAYDQAMWATLHGAFLRTTVWIFPETVMGFQVSPILALLAPLQLLSPDASFLIVLQRLALGAGVIPILLWAQQQLKSRAAVGAIGLAYLLNPVIWASNGHPFHQIGLAVPLLGLALFFQLNRRWWLFGLCAVLAIAVKEEVAFLVTGMGLYALIFQGERWRGLAIAGAALAWALACIQVIIPAFTGSKKPYFYDSYAYLGDSPAQMIWTVITHPWLLAAQFLSADKLHYIFFLLAPLGLLPLLGWRIGWMALPTLGYLFLGDPGRLDTGYYYGLPMVPFLFFAAVEGIRVIRRRVPEAGAALYAGAAAVAGYFLLGPGVGGFSADAFRANPRSPAIASLLSSVPADASVSANNNLMAHVSRRMNLHHFPEVLIPSDVFLVDFRGWFGWTGYPGNFNNFDQSLRRILHDPANAASYQGNGLLLVRKGALSPVQRPVQASFGDAVQLLGYDDPGPLQPGAPVTLHLRWAALRPIDTSLTVTLQLGNDANGKLAQRDSVPWEGYYPTLEWQPGQEIDDPETVTLPAGLATGQYRIFVGLYSLENGAAVPLRTESGESGVVLQPFAVESRRD